MYINRSSTDYIGLFGYINNATLTDLHVLNVDMTGNQSGGIVAGLAEGTSTINNSYSSGSISASYSVAGLIGLINATGVSINNCHTQVNVTSTSEVSAEASGFIGSTPTTPAEGFNPSITNSSSAGTVTAKGRNAGGFIGYFNGGTIEKCFSSVNIDATTSGQGNAGGFIGGMNAKVSSSYVNDCYAVGNVSGGSNNSSTEWHNGVGGFVGTIRVDYPSYTKNLTNCYSSGAVSQTGSDSIGGFIGKIASGGSATVTNCFWDTQTSDQSSSDGGTGKTTAEMKTKSTFLDVDWGIVLIGDYVDETWYINENNDYPRLGWEYASVETPTLSWWGTMVMIALFGGLLAFILRRKLITSSSG